MSQHKTASLENLFMGCARFCPNLLLFIFAASSPRPVKAKALPDAHLDLHRWSSSAETPIPSMVGSSDFCLEYCEAK
jgi:hypothetical protein